MTIIKLNSLVSTAFGVGEVIALPRESDGMVEIRLSTWELAEGARVICYMLPSQLSSHVPGLSSHAQLEAKSDPSKDSGGGGSGGGAKPLLGIGCKVRSAYGTGIITGFQFQSRDDLKLADSKSDAKSIPPAYVVKLDWELAGGSKAIAYLRPEEVAPILVPCQRIDTSYGAAKVLELREEGRAIVAEMTEWQLAGGAKVHMYLRATEAQPTTMNAEDAAQSPYGRVRVLSRGTCKDKHMYRTEFVDWVLAGNVTPTGYLNEDTLKPLTPLSVGTRVELTGFGCGTGRVLEHRPSNDDYKVELDSWRLANNSPVYAFVSSLQVKALPRFQPKAAVECAYGRGEVVQTREHDYVVELSDWRLADGQSPLGYLNEGSLSPLRQIPRGSLVGTSYGKGCVVDYRTEDEMYTVEMMEWQLADGVRPRIYCRAFELKVINVANDYAFDSDEQREKVHNAWNEVRARAKEWQNNVLAQWDAIQTKEGLQSGTSLNKKSGGAAGQKRTR